MLRSRTPWWSVLVLSIILSGCVSTQERYEKGVKYEDEGRYARAVEEYGKVLRKEPGWEEARSHLLDAGTHAVADRLANAHEAEAAGDYEAAVHALDDVERLRSIAAGVDVILPVPDDYTAYRQSLRDSAALSVIAQGRRAESAGEWPDALRLYTRAQERYPLSPAQTAEVNRRRADVHLAWGREELDRNRNRAAFEHAEQALKYDGVDARAAHDLQSEAQAQGTRHIAFIPFWRTDGWHRAAPPALRPELNDLLTYEHWSEPPLFIATANPADVHREIRYRHFGRLALDRHQATDVGRALDADFVVTGEMVSFSRAEKHLREDTRKARTRGRNALDTTYVVERFDLHLQAAIEYRVIDVQTGRIVSEQTVHAEVSDRFERGRYSGKYTDLDLTRSVRRLFEPDERADAEHMLMDTLADELADRLSGRIYDRLLSRID